ESGTNVSKATQKLAKLGGEKLKNVYGDEATYSSLQDKFLALNLSCPLFRPKGKSSWTKYWLFFIVSSAIHLGNVTLRPILCRAVWSLNLARRQLAYAIVVTPVAFPRMVAECSRSSVRSNSLHKRAQRSLYCTSFRTNHAH
ncbi:Wrap53, partial [Symbiodinium microadriaticum]